jgi:hypothetical protein
VKTHITVTGDCGRLHPSFEDWQQCEACKREQQLRRARQMWAGPFPDLFTADGRVRCAPMTMNRKFDVAFYTIILCLVAAGAFILGMALMR